jgi:hypothetical protein
MTERVFDKQYPWSSPGNDGQTIPIDILTPIAFMRIAYGKIPFVAPLALDPLWDTIEVFATTPCIIGFGPVAVTKPADGVVVPNTILLGASRDFSVPEQVIIGIPSELGANEISVIALKNPGELYINAVIRYEAIAIDESVTRG